MRLASAARRFDTMLCSDAYTGVKLFKAQLALYDDSKRDSEVTERRVLSVSPDVSIPARRAVEAAGKRYIVGSSFPDVFNGAVIRVGYVAHEASDLSTVYTLGQLAANLAGTQAWAGRAWVKNLAFSEQSSRLDTQHHLHFAVGEPVAADKIVRFESRYYLIRAWYYGPAGSQVTLCDELPEPVVETAQITGGVRDPVTATWSGAPAPVRVVRIRWQSLFSYRTGSGPKFGPEDAQIAIAKSVFTPKAGMLVTLSDGAWVLGSAIDSGDLWLCRASRHA